MGPIVIQGANVFDLDSHVRRVPDFPKPGIMFYDVTSIIAHPEAFEYVLQAMEAQYKDADIDAIVPVEARGFVFGAPLARKLGVPMILARKKGKLPGKTLTKSYALEYGTAELEMHTEDLKPGMKTLIVDDLIATGGTLKAACELVEELKGQVMGIYGVIGLPFLNYGSVLEGYDVKTLINYDSE